MINLRNASYRKRTQNNYSDEDKIAILQEYLTTDISMRQLCRKHHINHSSVSRWMRIFGIGMPAQSPPQLNDMPKNQKTQENPVTKEILEARLRELQSELKRERLKNLALTTMIEVAEEELHIDIRKKAGAKQ